MVPINVVFRRIRWRSFKVLIAAVVVLSLIVYISRQSSHSTVTRKLHRKPQKELSQTIHQKLSQIDHLKGKQKLDNLMKIYNQISEEKEEEEEENDEEEDDAKLNDVSKVANFSGKVVVWYLLEDDTQFEEIKNCGPYECIFHSDAAGMAKADAVIVDGPMLSRTTDRITPVRTSPDQIWMYYSKEPWSAYSSGFPYGKWNSIFNWTFTYHRDSEFIVPGGEVVKNKGNYVTVWDETMKAKTKQVLWIVNECKSDSRREEYVNELKKYINVDIMGDCGNPACTDDEVHGSCYEQYMFYLSFESVHCKDYITDNFFKTFDHPIVPIVRGGANYAKLYPKDLYIDTTDFVSPKHLAQHLQYLMKDTAAYMEYLKRRVNFIVMYRGNSECLICSYLYHLNIHRKSYPDLASWMGTCRKPTDLNF